MSTCAYKLSVPITGFHDLFILPVMIMLKFHSLWLYESREFILFYFICIFSNMFIQKLHSFIRCFSPFDPLTLYISFQKRYQNGLCM